MLSRFRFISSASFAASSTCVLARFPLDDPPLFFPPAEPPRFDAGPTPPVGLPIASSPPANASNRRWPAVPVSHRRAASTPDTIRPRMLAAWLHTPSQDRTSEV